MKTELQETLLGGVRVLELADEIGEYCGRRLAALGADVVKIEPPGGEATRRYGPFLDDVVDGENSLYFWHYNFNKRSVVLDLDTDEGQDKLRRLAARADVVIDARPRGYLAARRTGYEDLRAVNPGLIYARISPFGDSGPWADFKGSDLVHLALGGMMMSCGYDPEPSGYYETPPIAPQMWQAYHMGGEMAALGVMAALAHRTETGVGQYLSTAVHEVVSKNTELDVPHWIFERFTHHRLTCRPATGNAKEPAIVLTKDGRWLNKHIRANSPAGLAPMIKILKRYGMEMDLEDDAYSDPAYLALPATQMHIHAVINRLISRLMFDKDLWREAQAEGMMWAPVRKPEENLDDEHWAARQTFMTVHHEGLDRAFTDVAQSWRGDDVPPPALERAPHVGEHTDEVLTEFAAHDSPVRTAGSPTPPAPVLSARGKPFALAGVRIIDLSWMLASGGSGRYFTSLGAEVVKVEHSSRPDGYRSYGGIAPQGGREERARATTQLFPKPGVNRGGAFMDNNAGKRSVSLNLKDPQGMELLIRLLEDADMVIEGFSPGTMERMGLGYERLKEINPRIVYVQQSGAGQLGSLGRIRMFGPTAQALSGLSEMSGLPEPYPPAGIGYAYLDWFGAWNMASAMMAALYRQRRTGKGCYIDSSQSETGIWLSGTAVLDYSANGRHWSRYGNRSPYKLAAPHGVYRTEGDDRWIVIGCFTEEEWQGLVGVLGNPEWAGEQRFATLESRLAHQDELDRLLDQATQDWERFALMAALQSAGVPAGVCQSAEDRVEDDPQLKHLEWLIELPQTEIGIWPVKEFPVHFSETPAYMGGTIGRSGPNYGEDTEYVLGEILRLTKAEIDQLATDGVT